MSSARSLVDLLYGRNRADPKHVSALPGQAEPTDGTGERLTRPIPLVPGEPVDLRMPEVTEQDFPFEAGAPLPARGRSVPEPAALAPIPAPAPAPATVRKDITVSNIETILKEAMQIDGAIGVALVDYTSGMTLGQAGGGSLNLDVAAAGNTEVVRAKLRTMESLGLRDGIEDILITLDTQYHLIRLISDQSGLGLFLYLALNRKQANLALARHKLAGLERQIEI